ncbi:MAG: SDR family oxidoreductase [Lachnospiraceae bacterium]|jgi:NAD(P)-dependent dehydrogenase (short-subunit alcohol dehydrogenase family)|nr:SDR family oxidoreductase [Lachnospiraceae bacterium]
MQKKKLTGKTAVVTGAGRGIGREIALELSREGAALVIVSRTESELEETARMIEEAGGKVKLVVANLLNEEEVIKLKEIALTIDGKIDILVNNAGGYPKEFYSETGKPTLNLWEWSESQWDMILETNMKIPFLCLKTFLSLMVTQGFGDVVNISSRMGRIASQMGAYAVAKGGIITMTKTAAIQTKDFGVKVNAIAPGILDTPGQKVYNHAIGQDGVQMGEASSVAKAVLYLVADAPAVMTGQTLDLFTTL